MGRKIGLTLSDVVSAAAIIADERGIESLNLATVAEMLGVRPPSLYHHVDGVESLRRQVAIHGARHLADSFVSAARGLRGKKALLAIARAYREFARKHPGQLAAMLPADHEEVHKALLAPVAEITRVLTDLGIDSEDAIHIVRALQSFLHGFIDLERRGGFGPTQKVDLSFEVGLELFIHGVTG